MTITVLDSSNLDAILADATGEAAQEEVKAGEKKDDSKAETKGDEKKEAVAETEAGDHVDPDDVEGDDGLTPAQKKELSAKMLKAIGKKHRQMKEAEEFAASQYSERRLAEERAERLQRELEEAKPQKEQAPEATKPDRANFQNDVEYVEALADWKVDQKLKARDVQQAKEANERMQAEMLATAKGRITKALELVPDFQEVTEAADVEVAPVIAGYMQKSEMFAELGYYLAKHPEVVVSLSTLAPDVQLVQIGKIEGTLKPFSESFPDSTHADKASKVVTEAKQASETNGQPPSKVRNTAPVIKPLNTSGAATDKDSADMNIRETIADWQKKKGANLALRKRH